MVQQNWTVSILLSLYQALSFSAWATANLAYIIAKHGNRRLSISERLSIFLLPSESQLQDIVMLDCAVRKQAERPWQECMLLPTFIGVRLVQ